METTLITGGNAGLGLETAKRLAAKKQNLVLAVKTGLQSKKLHRRSASVLAYR